MGVSKAPMVPTLTEECLMVMADMVQVMDFLLVQPNMVLMEEVTNMVPIEVENFSSHIKSYQCLNKSKLQRIKKPPFKIIKDEKNQKFWVSFKCSLFISPH